MGIELMFEVPNDAQSKSFAGFKIQVQAHEEPKHA